MKEEQKIYIRGSKDRPDDVRKVLEQHGGKIRKEINFTYENGIYYIGHDGNIHEEIEGLTDSEYIQIIKDNYREIKLLEKWKDGDILVRKDNNNLFCVYQKPVDNGKGFLCHVYVSKDTLLTEVTVPTDPADNYRKATDAEKTTFYSLIDKHHMRWDAENKQLVDYIPKDKEELPQWEDGDILIRKNRTEYIVFRKYSYNTMFYNYDFIISKDENTWFSIAGEEYLYKAENFRLATSEEIKQFYALLHEMHKDWDSERKHLVKLKSEPTLSIVIG